VNHAQAKAVLGWDGKEPLQKCIRRRKRETHPDISGLDGSDFKLVCQAANVLMHQPKVDVTVPLQEVRPAKLTETQFTSKIRRQFPFSLKIHGSIMQESGIPDLYVCSHLWEGWLELKVGTRVVEKLQWKQMDRIRENGGQAFVLRYLQDGTMELGYREVLWEGSVNSQLLPILSRL
jgi:hypothetical protein